MANLSLSQLREVQKANPPSAGADCPPAALSLPLPASSPAQSVPSGGGGFTRIFPPEFASLAHVPADWKAANWSGTGAWCHVEGAERHPDFEANLLAVENSPEVVGLFPGC